MKVCLTDATKFTQEDRHFMISLETAKWELAGAEKELKWLKSAAASSEKDYEQLQRKVDEFQVKLDKERWVFFFPFLVNSQAYSFMSYQAALYFGGIRR